MCSIVYSLLTIIQSMLCRNTVCGGIKILSIFHTSEPWKDSFSLGPPLQMRLRKTGHRAMIAGPSIKIHWRQEMRARQVLVPAAQACQDPEAVVKSGIRTNRAIRSSSGGPCHSHPRQETVAWTNDALASLVTFHAHCMMNPMHLSIPKMPCKWFPLPDDYYQYSLIIYDVCHDWNNGTAYKQVLHIFHVYTCY